MSKFPDDIKIFKKILDSLPNSVYLKDKKGRYLWLNKSSINQLQHKHALSNSIIGKTDLEVFPKLNAMEYIKNDKKVIKEETGVSTEEIVILPSGEQLTQLSFKEPLYDDISSELIGILGYTIDITEIKKRELELRAEKEKAETANKTKIEFLKNMRHDIRTPLTGIIGFSELIKSEASDQKIKEYASDLATSGYALMNLLNEILEVIKVNSGDMPILKKKFNLQKKLHEVILLNKARALEKNLDLLLDYDSNIPNYLIGDPWRMYRIVLELITNALNFTQKGYVKLSAQLAKNDEDYVVIKIIIEDTGIGIESEKYQDIYLQFKRLTPSYAGHDKGYGLGLSIIKQLTNDLQGEIYLESRVDVGSRFIFVVKLKRALLDEELGSED